MKNVAIESDGPDLVSFNSEFSDHQQQDVFANEPFQSNTDASTFSIAFDYSLDADGFFGPQQRAVLEAAAADWAQHINDEFVDVPVGTELSVVDPNNTSAFRDFVLVKPIDDLLIFVGTSDLGGFIPQGNGVSGARLGEAYSIFASDGDPTGLRISFDFRGQGPTTDYEPYVGSISFNDNPDIDWSFDLDGAVAGFSDFYSTALHEIGHILGLVGSPSFNAFVENDMFGGPNALAENGGAPIPLETDGHVQDGFANDAVVMDPAGQVGVRRVLSPFDLALLADVGYQVDGLEKQGTLFELTTTGDDIPVFGSSTGDLIVGLDGIDQLQGEGGHDVLDGGAGQDTLFGGGEPDILIGGTGNDSLVLGPQVNIEDRDSVVFRPGDGEDVIIDFDPANDVIRVSRDFGFENTVVLAGMVQQFGPQVSALTFDGGDRLVIQHVDAPNAVLSSANFEIFDPAETDKDIAEFAARVIAYNAEAGDVVGDANVVFLDGGEIPDFGDEGKLTFATETGQYLAAGYRIDQIFAQDTFQAVTLVPTFDGMPGAPIVAVRGTTQTANDWYENFRPGGPGAVEFDRFWDGALGVEFREWLADHPGAHITGHSQGGSQAQMLAAEATSAGYQIGDITTYNSPGITEARKALFNPALAGDVIHSISAGDIVELAGETYLTGSVYHYNIQGFLPGQSSPVNYLLASHTGHVSDADFAIGAAISEGFLPDGESLSPKGLEVAQVILTTDELSSPEFTHLFFDGKLDPEYAAFLVGIANAPAELLGPELAYALSSRGGVEELRGSVGGPETLFAFLFSVSQGLINPLTQTTSAAFDTFQGLPQEAAVTISGWTLAAWQGVSTWTVETWTAARDLSVAAWQAIAQWSVEAWDAVSTWTAETWAKAKDLSVAAWDATVDGVIWGLTRLATESVEQVNQLLETGRSIGDAIDETGQRAWNSFFGSSEGELIITSNPNAIGIVATGQTATSDPDTASVVFGAPETTEYFGNALDNLFLTNETTARYIFEATPPQTEMTQRSIAANTVGSASDGRDYLIGDAENLFGDSITGFDEEDALFLTDSLGVSQIIATAGSAILGFDLDGDGASEGELTLEGDYAGQSFEVSSSGGDTIIRLAGPEASQLSIEGDRFITDDASPNHVYGDQGEDIVLTGAGDDIVSAGAGSDIVVAGAGMDTIIGGLGADEMTGGSGADVFAFSSRDFDLGFTADLITDFTSGEDVIELSGFGFTDLENLNFVTFSQGDAIDLGAGRFIVLEGLATADLSSGDVVGAEFARTYGLVSTTAGHRLTEGGDRFVTTDDGPNTVWAGEGDDIVLAAGGSDLLLGEAGSDVLRAGAGDDTIVGGEGNDLMTGNLGADRFEFESGEVGFIVDTILDFEVGIDVVALSGYGAPSFREMSGWGAAELGATEFIVFEGVPLDVLETSAADVFQFV